METLYMIRATDLTEPQNSCVHYRPNQDSAEKAFFNLTSSREYDSVTLSKIEVTLPKNKTQLCFFLKDNKIRIVEDLRKYRRTN